MLLHQQNPSGMVIHHLPKSRIPITLGRLWLGYRWSRYCLWSLRKGHTTGISSSLRSLGSLAAGRIKDAISVLSPKVSCNVCGWKGHQFYPNVGSGYSEWNTTCPKCHCIQRYRTLVAMLEQKTTFFAPESKVVEVAPFRTFQAYALWRKGDANYISFDIERYAMEKGDITKMRYEDGSCDFFLCFHVMEHIPQEKQALAEIFRVLKPGGDAVFQVPIDYSIEETVEYGKPNPLETDHVRRYSTSGFRKSLSDAGFEVIVLDPKEAFDQAAIQQHGLSLEPIYLGRKPAG